MQRENNLALSEKLANNLVADLTEKTSVLTFYRWKMHDMSSNSLQTTRSTL